VASPSRSAARRIALARLLSYAGTSAAFTALAYVVYRRTGSAGWVAATFLITLGLRGAVTPLAGALGDRFDRRFVMVWSDLLGALFFLLMPFAHAPWLLLFVAVFAVVAESPFFPASAAALPNLVAPQDLAWANGTIAFGSSVGYVAGPAIGGLLVAAGGAASVFLLNAASFVLSAALVASVRGAFSADRNGEDRAARSLRAGAAFMLRDPVLRTMVLAFAVFAVSVGSILVAELPLAAAFGAGAVGYGLLGTSFDLGAVFGALGARRLTEANERTWLVSASFVTAAGFAAVAVAPAFSFVLAAMIVSGASDGLVDVVVEVVFQRRSPDGVRSRVVAALETTFLLGLAVSFAFGALLVDALGPKAAYALAGGGCTVTAVLLLPLLRRAEQPSMRSG